MALISISMRGIHGDLYYRGDGTSYRIPVEHTGDYKKGLRVFLNMIEPGPSRENKAEFLREVRRDLQEWSKNNDQPLCW